MDLAWDTGTTRGDLVGLTSDLLGLLGDGVGHPQLSADSVARLATERILSQSVDIAIVAEAAAAAPRVMDDLRRAIAGWLESLR